MNQVTVKRWIVEKNLSVEEAQVVSMMNNTGFVEKETEKAVLVVFDSKYGIISSWFPKSQVFEATEEDEEFDEFGRTKSDIEFAKSWEKGLDYNNTLKEVAIANGIKGISLKRRLRTKTLIEKLTEAGIEVPARA